MNGQATRIAIVDNDPRALQSLSVSIERLLELATITFAATQGQEALAYCSKVDLWVLDMSLEDLQGPDLCRQLRGSAINATVPVLGVTSFSLGRYRDALIAAGGQALVDKSDDHAIIRAARLLLRGEAFAGFETADNAHRRIQREEEQHQKLTKREQEVIGLISEGMLDSDVAFRLGITQDTVRKHMQHVLHKLGFSTTRQAALYWSNKHSH